MGVRVVVTAMLVATFPSAAPGQTARWPEQKANAWYAQQPWLVGSNYVPRSAINQLEMWQEATFNPAQIDQELGWAEALGMNTMRVSLRDLLWQQDSVGFKQRIDRFLSIAARHHIRPLLVFFDSVWDPLPQLGPQHPPTPGVHNSGWVQSPGARALADPSQYPRLKAYVVGVVSAFAKDNRVLAWDIWNEPGVDNAASYPQTELKDKVARVTALLPQAFTWARAANPTQPLPADCGGSILSRTRPRSIRCTGPNCASPTSSPFTTTSGRSISSARWPGSSGTTGRSSAPSTWRAQ